MAISVRLSTQTESCYKRKHDASKQKRLRTDSFPSNRTKGHTRAVDEFVCRRAAADDKSTVAKTKVAVAEMESACGKNSCEGSLAAVESVACDLRNIGDELCGRRSLLRHRCPQQHLTRQQHRTETIASFRNFPTVVCTS